MFVIGGNQNNYFSIESHFFKTVPRFIPLSFWKKKKKEINALTKNFLAIRNRKVQFGFQIWFHLLHNWSQCQRTILEIRNWHSRNLFPEYLEVAGKFDSGCYWCGRLYPFFQKIWFLQKNYWGFQLIENI